MPPCYDTLLLAAALSEDVVESGDYLYVANQGFGMKVLKITNPDLPVEVGAIDSGFNMTTYSVACRIVLPIWSGRQADPGCVQLTSLTRPDR